MKRSLALLPVALLAFTGSAHAWSGGPWSGNTADNTAGKGTYQGTIRGKNVLGSFGFSSSPELSAGSTLTGLSSTNYFTTFYRGEIIYGNVSAIIDTAGRSAAGTFVSTNIQLITLDGGQDNPDTLEQVSIPGTSGGAFSGRITSTKPVLRFEGKGEFSTEQDTTSTTGDTSTDVDTDGDGVTDRTDTESASSGRSTTPITVQGVRTSLEVSVASSSDATDLTD